MNKNIRLLTNSTVLITGASGFIGSALTKYMVENNADVHIVVRRDSDLYRIKEVIKKVGIFEIDLVECDNLSSQLDGLKADYVFHCAETKHHELTNEDGYIKNLNSSLKMLKNVLDFTITVPVHKLIHLCSSSVYESGHEKFSELTHLNPSSFRGMIKLREIKLIEFYIQKYGLNAALGRVFRAYGIHDSKYKLIDKAIDKALERSSLKLVSNSIKRDYVHVDDICECLARIAMTKTESGDTFNIGSGKEFSAVEIIETLERFLPLPIHIEADSFPISSLDKEHYCADIRKSKERLNWIPKKSIEQGLAEIVECYQKKGWL